MAKVVNIRMERDHALVRLAEQELVWQARWERQSNPFLAWKDWMRPEFVAQRKAVYDECRRTLELVTLKGRVVNAIFE